MSGDEGKQAPGEMLRRPGRERNAAAGFEHSQHLATATAGRGAKIWPNWLSTTSNAVVGIGQGLGIALGVVDGDAGDVAFLRARSSSSGVRSSAETLAPDAPRSRDDAGAAGDVEHAFAGATCANFTSFAQAQR